MGKKFYDWIKPLGLIDIWATSAPGEALKPLEEVQLHSIDFHTSNDELITREHRVSKSILSNEVTQRTINDQITLKRNKKKCFSFTKMVPVSSDENEELTCSNELARLAPPLNDSHLVHALIFYVIILLKLDLVEH